MRSFWIAAAVAGLAALGCEISPVVSSPEGAGNRYQDCERAARAYCDEALRVRGAEIDACVAEHVYKCVSHGARAPGHGRS